MKIDLEKFYLDIEQNLSASREVFIKTALDDDFEGARSLDEARLILQALSKIARSAEQLIIDFPSLEVRFEKDFGKFIELTDREAVVETCFLEEYLFPETAEFPLLPDQVVEAGLVDNYVLSFKDWIADIKGKHLKTQMLILENFDIEMKQSDLICPCNKCTADYRARLRDHIYKDQVAYIDESASNLEDLLLEKSISFVSDYVSKLKKKLEKNQAKVRYRLKRGSLNKLDSEVKAHFKRKFGIQSDLGKMYKERLRSFFNGVIDDLGHSPDIVSELEYKRFFTQLSTNMWKNEIVLKKSFTKLVSTILAYKRKDISATILKEYLGQFWLHAMARRKKRKIIYHMGPTNSGKTWNSIEALSKAKTGCYLAPLRLLASELYDTLNEKGCATSLLTGEEIIEADNATHYSSTIEMAKLNEEFECVVIDEIQMITDTQRGWAWTRALININADEIHLAGDASVLELVEKILKLTGDTLEIKEYERKTKLTVMHKQIRLVDLEKNDALIVFSRRNALKFKRDLENLNFKVSIVYGRLSPEVRREQARKFDEGETDIIVATDAIAMGMNLPIKRIVFSATSKFWDNKEHPLTPSEIKQIAGRAGRFKLFPEGFVTTLQKVEDGLDIVESALGSKLDQKELAMVGPDLDIFRSVNLALEENNLNSLSLSEFLQLFNTMSFEKPFECVNLKEMIDVTEMVEGADTMDALSDAEIFGFACAPVNLGLIEHVQYYVWILNHYVGANNILNEPVDSNSDDIDYLETAIKCVELYQWLARHFDYNHFEFNMDDLLENKTLAIEKLNQLLSEKTTRKCSSCGSQLEDENNFNICEICFSQRRGQNRGGRRGTKYTRRGASGRKLGEKSDKDKPSDGPSGFDKRSSSYKGKKISNAKSAPGPGIRKKRKPKKSKASPFTKG